MGCAPVVAQPSMVNGGFVGGGGGGSLCGGGGGCLCGGVGSCLLSGGCWVRVEVNFLGGLGAVVFLLASVHYL